MFDLPEAKRIRRIDLYSPSRSSSPSPSPDPTLTQILHSHLAAIYGPISTPLTPQNPPTPLNAPQNTETEAEQEQTYEFRLFSTPSSTSAPQKIVLQDEDSTNNGGFVRKRRNKSYYFTHGASPSQKARYTSAALTGQQIYELSRKRAWGLEVPWRVRILSSSTPNSTSKAKAKANGVQVQSQPSVCANGHNREEEEGEIRKKTKPGKKRRIVLREKARKLTALSAQARIEREKREEAEREKRTRRNREKKVKRKLKEKAKAKKGETSTAALSPDGKE